MEIEVKKHIFAMATYRINESELKNLIYESIYNVLLETTPTRLGTRSGLGKKLQRAYDNGSLVKIRTTRTDDNNDRALDTIPTIEDMTQSFDELISQMGIEPVIHLNYYSFHEFKTQYTLTITNIRQTDVGGILMDCVLVNKKDANDIQRKQMVFTNDSMIKPVHSKRGDDYEIRKGISPEGQQNKQIVSALMKFKTDYLNAEISHSM